MNRQLVIGALIGAAAVTLAAGVSLTWLLVLACPLMMIFMHRGHGHGSQHRASSITDEETASRGPRDEIETGR